MRNRLIPISGAMLNSAGLRTEGLACMTLVPCVMIFWTRAGLVRQSNPGLREKFPDGSAAATGSRGPAVPSK